MVIADALCIIQQAIRDAARLGTGPEMLLTNAVSAAELYRQSLATALDQSSFGRAVAKLHRTKLPSAQLGAGLALPHCS
jgi:hypothetical protein